MIAADDPTLKQQLITHEGYRTHPYLDTKGNITIGIGENLTANGLAPDIIDALYARRMGAVLDGIAADLPWTEQLPPNQQRVLADIGYNAGVHGLMEFQKMLGFLQAGDLANACAEIMNSAIAPARAQRLEAILRTP